MLKVFLSMILLLSFQAASMPEQPVIDLNKQYQIDNDMWFEGKLPPAHVVLVHMKDLMGQTSIDGDHVDVVLDSESNVTISTIRLTLFHEECHIEEWPGPNSTEDQHGPKWQGCMQRLAREGAFAKVW